MLQHKLTTHYAQLYGISIILFLPDLNDYFEAQLSMYTRYLKPCKALYKKSMLRVVNYSDIEIYVGLHRQHHTERIELGLFV